MHATAEQIEAFKKSNYFSRLAEKIFESRRRILEAKGISAGNFNEFAGSLNSIIVHVLAGPDHAIAINQRISIALRGTTVHWGLRDRNLPNEDIAEARDFLETAAEKFGVSTEGDKGAALAKRYRPLFDEAYRRRPKSGGEDEGGNQG